MAVQLQHSALWRLPLFFSAFFRYIPVVLRPHGSVSAVVEIRHEQQHETQSSGRYSSIVTITMVRMIRYIYICSSIIYTKPQIRIRRS